MRITRKMYCVWTSNNLVRGIEELQDIRSSIFKFQSLLFISFPTCHFPHSPGLFADNEYLSFEFNLPFPLIVSHKLIILLLNKTIIQRPTTTDLCSKKGYQAWRNIILPAYALSKAFISLLKNVSSNDSKNRDIKNYCLNIIYRIFPKEKGETKNTWSMQTIKQPQNISCLQHHVSCVISMKALLFMHTFSGGKWVGSNGLVKSQIQISPSSAPEAIRCGVCELNSKPRTWTQKQIQHESRESHN